VSFGVVGVVVLVAEDVAVVVVEVFTTRLTLTVAEL
jgi:hypothetical protein